MKKKKKRPLACINGVKGAISLFLAVLMTPFLTIALLLVETGRYNSAVSILDEALGVSSVSTLADYDRYLQNRWGLMGLSQGTDHDKKYKEVLQTNASVMGGAINIKECKLKKMYGLSDPDILKNQIMEYSKFNAPTTLAMEFLNLSDLIGKLEKLTKMGDIVSLLTSGVDAVDSGITLVESAEKLKESANKLDGLHDDYENSYSEFETRMNNLVSSLQQKRQLENQKAPLESELSSLEKELAELKAELEELQKKKADVEAKNQEISQKEKQIQDKKSEINGIQKQINTTVSTIASRRTVAEEARNTYADTLQSISSELANFQELMADCSEAVKSIQGDILNAVTTAETIQSQIKTKEADLEALKAELKKKEKEGYTESDPSYSAGLDYKIALEQEVADLKLKQGVNGASAEGLKTMTDSWDTSFKSYSDATLGEIVKGFQALRQKVRNVNISGANADTPKITRSEYKNVALGGYINASEIDEYLTQQENELKSGSLKAMIDGMIAVYEKLMGLSIFFEDNLDACLNLQYYNDNIGGLPGGENADGGILEVVKNIGDVCSSASGFVENFAKLKLLKALKELKNLITNIIDLLKSIGQLALDLVKNIADLLTGYDRWYLGTYAAYNLSCRTDYSTTGRSTSVTTMTGYSAGADSFPKSQNTPDAIIFGELATLIQTITTYMKNTGKDISFSGAELEYILFGSTSEVANQLYVFCALYLIRLLFNIPSITSNVEVQGLAASATLGYPVIIGLYIILEPLVQTVLLVNGSDQALVPTTVYLAPSGIPKLIGELVSFCSITDEQAKEIEDSMVSAISSSKDDYDYQKKLAEYSSEGTTKKALFELSYKEYCLILLLLTVAEPQLVARISNIIQTETTYYYNNKGADYIFDLKKSYSYLYVWVDADVNQVMPSLADSSLFSIEREHYRGY